jgi:hypothetical protein
VEQVQKQPQHTEQDARDQLEEAAVRQEEERHAKAAQQAGKDAVEAAEAAISAIDDVLEENDLTFLDIEEERTRQVL